MAAPGPATRRSALGLRDQSNRRGGPSPVLLGAFADNASGGSAGLQAGDRVMLIFDFATNAITIDALNIDTVLPLGAGHSWQDGAAATGSAVLTTTTYLNDTLVITLSTAISIPIVALGDSVNIGAGTIRDVTNGNDAVAAAITVGDSFDRDALMLTAPGPLLVFASTTNQFAVNAANINTTLVLNNGHRWLDGAGAIGGPPGVRQPSPSTPSPSR
jgi:hypothetical protein